MIKNFQHKGLQDFFYGGSKKRIQPKHARKLADVLDRLDAAAAVGDMDFPGSGLHPLKGDKAGCWAVKISGNWRIIFSFNAGNAEEVDYVDYH